MSFGKQTGKDLFSPERFDPVSTMKTLPPSLVSWCKNGKCGRCDGMGCSLMASTSNEEDFYGADRYVRSRKNSYDSSSSETEIRICMKDDIENYVETSKHGTNKLLISKMANRILKRRKMTDENNSEMENSCLLNDDNASPVEDQSWIRGVYEFLKMTFIYLFCPVSRQAVDLRSAMKRMNRFNKPKDDDEKESRKIIDSEGNIIKERFEIAEKDEGY